MENPNNQIVHASIDVPPEDGSECFNDDRRPKRTGEFIFVFISFPKGVK